MEDVKFTIFELQALHTFLKDYINKDNLSIYEGSLPRHLLLAYLKLEQYIEDWKEKMSPSD